MAGVLSAGTPSAGVPSAETLSDQAFRNLVEKKVRRTIRKHRLFTLKDRIAVAVSGGKDSVVCMYILKKMGYSIRAVTIDPGIGKYSQENLKNLKSICKRYEIALDVISFKEELGMGIRKILSKMRSEGIDYSACMICGILKRYLLNRYAKENSFVAIATGHNLDDEAQAFLMNVFRNDFRLAVRQGPKPGITRSAGFVQRVKPLYNISEQEIIRYSKAMRFPVYYGICPLSTDAYRRQFIAILDGFEKKHPSVKYNILGFQEIMAKGIKSTGHGKSGNGTRVGRCERCGEPSSNSVCKACHIMEKLELHNSSPRKTMRPAN
ncbi:TIGR00269 family protein [Candidatus Woesearchaeota archaeon]|nr:TIGR00269 family protein [Candidatus Woesearchaeota archaeon]